MKIFETKRNILEQIFELYERPMYFYALKITKNPNASEDIVQNAFCKLMKYMDHLGEVDSPQTKSYLFAMIKTCATDYFRSNKISNAMSDPLNDNILLIEDTSSIENSLSELSFDGQIGEYVLRLKEADQIILYLKYGRDISDEQIAGILGLNSAGTVRQRLSRARCRLKTLFENEEGKCGTNE